jgi:hypothetical protein
LVNDWSNHFFYSPDIVKFIKSFWREATANVDFDNLAQLKRIEAQLLPGETLYAVYDMKGGGTGFIGISDIRLIFFDQSFVSKKKAMVTLPYTKITAFGFEDSGGVIFKSGTLFVVAGSREWTFEFRGADKAQNAYRLIASKLLQTEAKGI